MTQAKAQTEPVDQELDAWWGSYSGWTMWPSWLVCVLLFGLLAYVAWSTLPRGWGRAFVQITTALVWALQFARWGYRVFGYNYRLTTKRLLFERGIFFRKVYDLPLTGLEEVEVEQTPLEKAAGVGRVLLLQKSTPLVVVLEGVAHPERVAEFIQHQRDKALAGQPRAVLEPTEKLVPPPSSLSRPLD